MSSNKQIESLNDKRIKLIKYLDSDESYVITDKALSCAINSIFADECEFFYCHSAVKSFAVSYLELTGILMFKFNSGGLDAWKVSKSAVKEALSPSVQLSTPNQALAVCKLLKEKALVEVNSLALLLLTNHALNIQISEHEIRVLNKDLISLGVFSPLPLSSMVIINQDAISDVLKQSTTTCKYGD